MSNTVITDARKIQQYKYEPVPMADRVLLVDSDGNTYTPGSITNKPLVRSGRKVVTTAGVPVQMDSLTVPNGFAVRLVSDTSLNGTSFPYNQEDYTLGKLFIKGAEAEANGFFILPGNTVSLYVTNMNQIWIDSEQNGQVVVWIVEQSS